MSFHPQHFRTLSRLAREADSFCKKEQERSRKNICVGFKKCKKVDVSMQNIQCNQLCHRRLKGSKVSHMTILHYGPEEITSLLLLISSNDVPEGGHPLCHYLLSWKFSISLLFLLLCVTEWMFHAIASLLTVMFIFHLYHKHSCMTLDSIETRGLHNIIRLLWILVEHAYLHLRVPAY